MRKYLRDTAEFQHVYRNGKRFEGVFITAFVIENQERNHRLGVTASKKALGKAVQRNRAKRLLRETFRLNETLLSELSKNYDLARGLQATGTPTFVIGDRVLQGAVGYEALKQAVADARGR